MSIEYMFFFLLSFLFLSPWIFIIFLFYRANGNIKADLNFTDLMIKEEPKKESIQEIQEIIKEINND